MRNLYPTAKVVWICHKAQRQTSSRTQHNAQQSTREEGEGQTKGSLDIEY